MIKQLLHEGFEIFDEPYLRYELDNIYVTVDHRDGFTTITDGCDEITIFETAEFQQIETLLKALQ